MIAMNKKVMLFILPLLSLLLLSTSYGATFLINNTESGAWDYVYNSTDEYGIYLEYLNPYGVECDDLRECFIDDSNSPSGFEEQPDYDFLIDNFFEGDTNIVPVWLNASFKHSGYTIDSQPTYVLNAYFNDTSNSDYYALVQKGTVWDKYKLDLVNWTTLRGNLLTAGNCPTTFSKCNTVAETDDYEIFSYRGSITPSGNFNYTVWYLNGTEEDVAIFVYEVYDDIDTPTYDLRNSGSYITTHYQKFEHDTEISFLDARTKGGVVSYAYSSSTNFVPLITTSTGYWNSYFDHNTYWFKGLGIPYNSGSGDTGFFIMPKLQIGVEGNYRSVGLPTCEDIYIGNVQTNFYWNEVDSWFRECSGSVPAVNTTELSCELSCLAYEDIYAWDNKTISGTLIDTSATQYTTHISLLNRADGYAYVWDSETPLSQIGDVRIYSYLDFESNNATQTFSIEGWNKMGTVPNTFTSVNPYSVFERTCFNGVQNVTAYATWGYFNYVLNEDIAGSYTDLEYYNTEFSIDWLALNGYYNVYYDFTKATSECATDLNQPIDTLGNKEIIYYVEWENTTVSETVCSDYEAICYPVEDEGYFYDNESIVCVGLSCYVVSEPICNYNAICEIDRGESNANCPADCLTETIPEVVDTITETIEEGFGYLGTILGTDSVGAKALIWFVISLVVAVALGGVLAVKGASGSGAGLMAVVTLLGMILIGTLIAWLPAWFGILFIVLAGLMLVFAFRSIFMG